MSLRFPYGRKNVHVYKWNKPFQRIQWRNFRKNWFWRKHPEAVNSDFKLLRRKHNVFLGNSTRNCYLFYYTLTQTPFIISPFGRLKLTWKYFVCGPYHPTWMIFNYSAFQEPVLFKLTYLAWFISFLPWNTHPLAPAHSIHANKGLFACSTHSNKSFWIFFTCANMSCWNLAITPILSAWHMTRYTNLSRAHSTFFFCGRYIDPCVDDSNCVGCRFLFSNIVIMNCKVNMVGFDVENKIQIWVVCSCCCVACSCWFNSFTPIRDTAGTHPEDFLW